MSSRILYTVSLAQSPLPAVIFPLLYNRPMLKCAKIVQQWDAMQIGRLQLTNNVILAPMAGITDLPYRLLMKRFGAGLVFTEMVSANGLVRAGNRTRELLRSDPAERPLGVQLFGADPEVLAAATLLVGEAGDLLDLNLGCPVNKVVRSGAGSALLRDPGLVGRIVAAVVRSTVLPVTVKIRSGWDNGSVNFLEIGRIAEAEGAAAVTLHPRTRSQGFGGRADWSQIAELKAALRIPVVGSGDILEAADALAMQAATDCDGVMIGRGAYGNPWLIRDILALQAGTAAAPPTPRERLQVAGEHLQAFTAMFGAAKTLREMRKHLCWYSRGLDGAAGFRGRVNHARSLAELEAAMAEFFTPGEEPSSR